MHDVRFHSPALDRDEVYRVVGPTAWPAGSKLHVVYLLHGNGGGYKDWSEHAPLAAYAARGYYFIMPEGHSSYWMNSVSVSQDRYEDYVTLDLIADAERRLPADRDRSIAGVSMGGFGALVLALKHPELYTFAGAFSPPVDVPERHFTWRRLSQSWSIRRIFGPYGGATRELRDPFSLVPYADRNTLPPIYLGVGEEPLLDPVERFARKLKYYGFRYRLQVRPGGHDWQQWNLQFDQMMQTLARP